MYSVIIITCVSLTFNSFCINFDVTCSLPHCIIAKIYYVRTDQHTLQRLQTIFYSAECKGSVRQDLDFTLFSFHTDNNIFFSVL